MAGFWHLAAAFRHPRPSSGTGHVRGSVTVVGYGRSILSAGPGAPLERRVAILEENLARLQHEFDRGENNITTELHNLNNAIEEERRSREKEANWIRGQLEEVAVGGLHLEYVGLAWLVLGVLGTSIPSEIAILVWP
jgi:hypothetical protein